MDQCTIAGEDCTGRLSLPVRRPVGRALVPDSWTSGQERTVTLSGRRRSTNLCRQWWATLPRGRRASLSTERTPLCGRRQDRSISTISNCRRPRKRQERLVRRPVAPKRSKDGRAVVRDVTTGASNSADTAPDASGAAVAYLSDCVIRRQNAVAPRSQWSVRRRQSERTRNDRARVPHRRSLRARRVVHDRSVSIHGRRQRP